ncbi:zeatin O-glucosyltransferase-like [Solanum dulcamara]|uniref:zeatin O-glucosyltransferase-like n=1 Tax=Solanum dulcamara TaxID=45834 RepID=UPI0024855FE2|nr:zeatin O-glucosyltransferase-like [Solanum dulcamara]
MAEKITTKNTYDQNIGQEATRGGATVDEGWSVGQNGPQDVRGVIIGEGLSVDQNSLKDGKGGSIVDEGWSVDQNGMRDIRVRAKTNEGWSVSQNIVQDVGGEGGSIEHPLPKNQTILKFLTSPLRDNARVAAKDVKGEATTDVEGGHSSLENHTIAKFLTPPLRDDARVVVVMVPLPAQGHLNQLLHLSRLISMYNIQVYYIGITSHIQQAKIRAHGFDPLTITKIHFHEFHQTPFETPLPNPNASFKFPNQLLPSFYATSHLREPVCLLVRELLSANHRKVVVIYDSLMKCVVQDLPQLPNTECYCFNSTSAFMSYSYLWELKGKPLHPGTENYEDIPTIGDSFPPEFWEFLKTQEQVDWKINCGELYNSSRVIESLYLDLMAKEYDGMKQWAIGPFNPMEPQEKSKGSNKRHESLDWLDKQERDSVIFVSFGTTTSLCDEEIKVLAIGLEKSLQKFIWVLRDADKGDVFTSDVRKVQLLDGYEERIKERGIIVRDWAPQLEILAHSSTGGFMSHCGWNSCMESMSFGVPIAAWPMHSDQPRNSQLVTKYLKIGLIVRPWACRDEVVTSEVVENAVKTLMASSEGDEMRKRAANLSNAIKKSVTDGGMNRAEMDSFIAHITR